MRSGAQFSSGESYEDDAEDYNDEFESQGNASPLSPAAHSSNSGCPSPTSGPSSEANTDRASVPATVIVTSPTKPGGSTAPTPYSGPDSLGKTPSVPPTLIIKSDQSGSPAPTLETADGLVQLREGCRGPGRK